MAARTLVSRSESEIGAHARRGRGRGRTCAVAIVAGTLLCAAVLVPAASGRAAQAAETKSYAQARGEWLAVVGSKSLPKRFEALAAVVETKDPRALALVLDAYGQDGGRHQDKLRERIAPLVATAFSDERFVPVLEAALLSRLDGPEHGWLAYRCCREQLRLGRRSSVVAFLGPAGGHPFVQAAALRALAEDVNMHAVFAASAILDGLRTKGIERAVVAEAVARVFERITGKVDEALSAPCVDRLLTQLDLRETPARTKTVIGRVLKTMLGTTVVYDDAASWRRAREDRATRKKLAAEGYATGESPHSYFLGVRFQSRNVVFVIDTSGSMSAPVSPPSAPTPERKPDPAPPKRGPVTGPTPPAGPSPEGTPPVGAKERERERERARAAQDALNGLDELPWEKIRCRFDAAREALKLCVRAMRPEQHVAIVFFSNDARTLDETTSLIPATPANVERICAGLDRSGIGGSTNLHRGIELAFELSRAAADPERGDVGEQPLLSGADAIVVLTDGMPTAESYGFVPRGGAGPAGLGVVPGDGVGYTSDAPIIDAVRRWNLYRDVEVSCVGFQTAPASLLRAIADTTGGRLKVLDE